ncbi:MAG: HAMP domain-containing protein [Anaerolinea sp.]|nr:HAMP domain-containing protein [Anaerolinea sp.]MCC6974542.1 HAMP domain-containing protein [Anaerolineae bacterium]CAG1002926.1 Sensor protein kinase WalK [Anaerolineae bacterium]
MSVTPAAPKPRFISMRLRLLTIFTLVFALFAVVVFVLFYLYSTDAAMNRIRDDMIDTLKGGIAGVDGDVFQIIADFTAEQPEFPNDPRYARHQDWLATIHRLEPRAYPYTLKPTDNPREGLWVGDILRITRSPTETKWLESYTSDTSKLFDGFKELTTNMEPYTDKWGSWVSAYAPILNSQGKTVGVMGVDFEASYVYSVQRTIMSTAIVAFGFSFLVLFIVIWLVSGALTRPITDLTQTARELGEGRYDIALDKLTAKHGSDEIGVLAQVFRSMTEKVRQREETLVRKVHELSIQIDYAQRERQISQVTDSEFFKDLQSRVQNIRQRKPASSPSETQPTSQPSSQPSSSAESHT